MIKSTRVLSKLIFLTAAAFAVLAVGTGSQNSEHTVDAVSTSMTSTFSTSSWGVSAGNTWTAGTGTTGFLTGAGVSIASGVTANATTVEEYRTITQIVVTYSNNNTGQPKATLRLYSNISGTETQLVSQALSGKVPTSTPTTFTWTGSVTGDAKVKLELNTTAQTYYIKSVQITSERHLTGIAITTQPTDKSYYRGQSFDPAGMVVTATFHDTVTSDVTSSTTFTPTVFDTVGTVSVTISYTFEGRTKTASVTNITVAQSVLNSISIKTASSLTSFALGGTFSYPGLVITAAYDFGNVDLTTGFTVNGVNMMVLGTQTATITLESKTTTYNITVTMSGTLATAANQSAAYATYFLNITGPYCEVLNGGSVPWSTLGDEYGYMSVDAKDLFASTSTGDIQAAKDRYSFLITKYTALKTADNFMTDGDGIVIFAANESAGLVETRPTTQLATMDLMFIAFGLLATAGLAFVLKKKQ